MNLSFNKDSGQMLQFGGFAFIAEYSASKSILNNAISILSEALTISATTATLETTLGVPATGNAFIGDLLGTETFTLTSKSDTLKQVYGTRSTGAPLAHTKGEMLNVVGTSGYARFFPFGFIDKMSIDPGKKARTKIYDHNGKVRGSSNELNDPVFKITGLQSGIMERALLFARDISSTEVLGMKRMSTTALEDFAFFILTAEKDLETGAYKYGMIRIPHAQLSTTSELPFTQEVKKLEYTFNLIEDTTIGDFIVIDMEA